jgi:hypothetical protein
MKGEPETYFNYAIPAMLFFIAGLNLFSKKYEEIIDLNAIKAAVNKMPALPPTLVITGIVGFLIVPFAPSEISLIFVAISYLRFVGFFLSLLADKPFNLIYFLLSFGILTVESLFTSMFSDLLYLAIFFGIFLSLRYRPSVKTTLLGIFAGVLMIVFIQNIKFSLRSKVTGAVIDLETLRTVIQESEHASEQKQFDKKVADVVLRIDQGWVTSSTIEKYRLDGFSFQNGKHAITILESSILPRFLAPDKYKVGDRELFNTYSGHQVSEGTSIALGVLADGYIDFGESGIFIVFAFGLIINLFIKLYHKWSIKFPVAKVFIAVGLLYAIKADTDTHSSLGALFKVSVVIWFILKVIEYKSRVANKNRSRKWATSSFTS